MKRKGALFISLLVTILIFVNLSIINHLSSNVESVRIDRVIDGDTLELEDGRRIRLLNINAPEKDSPAHVLSLNFLKSLNSSINLEVTGTDKYGRALGRVYSAEYVNLQLIEQGLASKFLVDSSELKDFASAEKKAIKEGKGIWPPSPYSNCFKATIDKEQEFVVLDNNCPSLKVKDWTLKDESRKTYKFNDIKITKVILYTKKGNDNSTDIFWNSDTNIWNNDRDSLYLFDNKGGLASYETYGY